MAASDKDTIYIDIDDEITGIIDKVQSSSGKVVALVLPKRASVFQSIVNMKLLKRAADSAQKHLVLITSEAGLLPLAGMAGVHVAKTLTSKPEIPVAPGVVDDSEEAVAEDNTAEPEITAASAGDEPVGRLAGMGILPPPVNEEVETLVLDDDSLPPESAAVPVTPKVFDPPKGKKNKGLRIPNFERFRLLLVLGVLALILLIGGLIFAANVLPKAIITIDTDSQSVDAHLKLNLSTVAKTLEEETGTVPAKLQQHQKTFTQQTPATGQKNNGNKANGSVVFYNCNKDDLIEGQDRTIPAGTGISSNGLTYITQESVSVPPSNYTGDNCKTNRPSSSVDVIAQAGGANYNVSSGTSFSVSLMHPSDGSRSFSAKADDSISGGTDNMVQVVSQNDINTAKAKINIEDPAIKGDLQDQLKQAGYFPLPATYSSGTPTVTSSANIGDTAANVTVTQVVTYTMFGVQERDLEKLVENDVESQIDTSKQSILSHGVEKARFSLDAATATTAQLTMSSVAVAGPELDINTIKLASAGQKSGKIKDDLEARPGVKSVTIELSPFWVSSIPKKSEKIIIVIAEPKTTAGQGNGSSR